MEQELLIEKKWKTRIVVKKGMDNLVVKVTDIALFWIQDRIVFVLDRDANKYMMDKCLTDVSEQLDPALFFRINRQAIVNIHFIKSYRVFKKVKLSVDLTIRGTNSLIVSQERTPLFKNWISGE